MEIVKNAVHEIIEHVKHVLESIDSRQIDYFTKTIINSNRVFIYGAGRSGLVGKAFGMRLSHLAKETFIIGETITPSVRKGDVVIVISGSGETTSALNVAETSRRIGARTIAITSNPNSRLSRLAEHVIIVPGKTKLDMRKRGDYLSDQLKGVHEPITPLGTLFEDSCQLLLDGIIVKAMKEMGKDEREMVKHHANIE